MWISENKGTPKELHIDSVGGAIFERGSKDPEYFYKLVNAISSDEDLVVRVENAHSAAALIALSAHSRTISQAGIIVLKNASVTMPLRNAAELTKADIERYAEEWRKYKALFEALLRSATLVSDEHINCVLKEDAALVFNSTNALGAKLVNAIH